MTHLVSKKNIKRQIAIHWPLLIPIGIFLLLNAPLVVMKGIVPGLDGLTQFYPATYTFKQALLAGNLPHWTTTIQSGFPILASGQPGVLYPLNFMLINLLPVPVAYNMMVLLHGLLAVIFTYAWGRTLKFSALASALMSCLFMLTTPLAGGSIPMLEALAWVPALFLLTERILKTKKLSSLWPICLVIGLQWLIGYPQMALYSLITCFVYIAVRLLKEPFSWKQRVYWLMTWLCAAFIGILLATPLLFPTYELSLFSIRANGISGSLAGEKSLFPFALTTFLFPTAQTFWINSGLGGGAYIAVIPFLLAMGAFFRKPKPRWFYPIVTMSLVATVLAFGRFSPFFPIIRQIPGLSSFRASSRIIYFVQFGLITLFGWNWDHLFTVPHSTANKWQERIFLVAIAIFMLISLIGYPLISVLKPQLVSFASDITFNYIINDGFHLQSEAYYVEKIDTLYQNALAAMWSGSKTMAPLVSLLLGWLLIRLVRRNNLSVNVAYGGLVLLIGFDLLVFTGEINHAAPLALVTEKSETAQLIDQIMADALCRLYALPDKEAIIFKEDQLEMLPPNFNSVADIDGTGIYNPVGFYDYYRLLESIGGVNLAYGQKPINGEDVAQNKALLNFLNVCAITSRKALAGFELMGQADDVFVYRNASFLPRAYAVDEAIMLPADADVVTAVLANIDTLPTKAILQEKLSDELTVGAAQNTEINIEEYQDLIVKIDVITEGTILLQLTDNNYPGWRATIDGTSTEIITTNALFRGIVVPEGKHEIIFSYVPNTFRLGLLVSVFALILLGIWFGIWLFRRTR